MEPEQFEKLDRLSDEAYDKFKEWYGKGFFKDLEEKLGQIGSFLKENYSVSLNLELDIFDSEREKTLTLMKTGIACIGGEKPYRADSGSTVHTYLVDGKIRKIPHDYCPSCWGEWDFKLRYPACPECGMELGKDVQLLLDTDVCPNCEKGKVSRSHPKCSECGYLVNTDMIHWG